MVIAIIINLQFIQYNTNSLLIVKCFIIHFLQKQILYIKQIIPHTAYFNYVHPLRSSASLSQGSLQTAMQKRFSVLLLESSALQTQISVLTRCFSARIRWQWHALNSVLSLAARLFWARRNNSFLRTV